VIAHDLEHLDLEHVEAILGVGVLIVALLYMFWRLRHAS
jgi:hypothetical protein